MREYLSAFFEEFEYPEESRQVLGSAFDKICADPEASATFSQLMDAYTQDKNCDYGHLVRTMAQLSETVQIHRYTGQLLLYIGLSKQLKEYYRGAGISLSVWHNSMLDLKYKLWECWEVYRIWGTFVDWFDGFYRLTRFALGRLQFDMATFGRNYSKNGVILTPESKVLGVHIPRTMTRLDYPSVQSAYAEADAFFKQWLGGAPTVFICDSWLLFSRHWEMLSPTSNILAFINDYEVIHGGLFDDYEEIWRLFDCNYTPDLDKLPQNSSLRRSYVELMRKGEKIGWGFGVYIYK